MTFAIMFPFLLMGLGLNWILKGIVRGMLTRFFMVGVLLIIYASMWGNIAESSSDTKDVAKSIFANYSVGTILFALGMVKRFLRFFKKLV